MYCSNCKLHELAGKHCGKCGNPLIPSICSSCSTELTNGAFCGKCGTRLVDPNAIAKSGRKIAGTISALVAVSAVVVLVVSISVNNSNIEKAAQEKSAAVAAASEANKIQAELSESIAKQKRDSAARKAAKEAEDLGTADGWADSGPTNDNQAEFPEVEVPNFLGLTQSDAIFLAMRNGLQLGTKYSTYNPDSACTSLQTGLVILQSIAPRTVVSTDTRLTQIWITVDCSR